MNRFIDNAAESMRLINSGKIEEALRLSSENLVEADNQLRQKFDQRENIALCLDAFAIAADAHVMSLVASEEPREAFSVTLLSLMQINALKAFASESIEKGIFKLLLSLLNLNEIMTSNEPEPIDDESTTHMTKIMEYSFSLFKGCVERLKLNEKKFPDDILLGDKIIRRAGEYFEIQYPLVDVNGKEIDVADPTEIYADLAGRAVAIGWLNV